MLDSDTARSRVILSLASLLGWNPSSSSGFVAADVFPLPLELTQLFLLSGHSSVMFAHFDYVSSVCGNENRGGLVSTL